MNWKELAKTAAIALAVVYGYHTGVLNFIPQFKAAKTVA